MNNNKASLAILTKTGVLYMLAFFISCAIMALLVVMLFTLKIRIDIRVVLAIDQERNILDLELLPLGREKLRRQKRLQLPPGELFYQLIAKLSQKNPYQIPGWFSSLSKAQKVAFIKKMLVDVRRFVKDVHITEFHWLSICGGEDAMEAALRTGSLWAVKGIIISLASRLCHLDHFKIKVEPDFAAERLWSRFAGIFKVRLVHIMVIGAHITVWIIRGYLNGRTAKRKSVQSPHRGTNENCYAKY
ncbi:MAG TPA: DUF2953 domain-containing protein [Syntrophomonadaceae bacterium]|nr:DUF2953 domain-containing protein [Syntrophomonadaceae bacterium]HQE22989.1 DUF2953 domain-containing protein [Syntrophomonadaceae bacterium]